MVSQQIFQRSSRIFHLEPGQKNIGISSAGIAIQIALSEARQQGVAVAIHLCRCSRSRRHGVRGLASAVGSTKVKRCVEHLYDI